MIGHGQPRKLAADADAGVGNDQINRAELGMRLLDRALDVAIASDIGFIEEDAAAAPQLARWRAALGGRGVAQARQAGRRGVRARGPVPSPMPELAPVMRAVLFRRSVCMGPRLLCLPLRQKRRRAMVRCVYIWECIF